MAVGTDKMEGVIRGRGAAKPALTPACHANACIGVRAGEREKRVSVIRCDTSLLKCPDLT